MDIKNEFIKNQLEHKTIREFEERELESEIRELLLEVARRTATSNGMQQFSIVRITDPEIKMEISKVAKQEYINRIPELWIFIADQHRNKKIIEEKGVEKHFAANMDRFFQAFTDACLAAQNVVSAAESMEIGTLYLGSILNDSEKICELLRLPELTFPVVGLGLGYPGQEPQIKPRMESSLRVFENTYQSFEHYLDKFQTYDEEMQTYYDLRDKNKRMDSFTKQVADKYQMALGKRQDILKVVKHQGFME